MSYRHAIPFPVLKIPDRKPGRPGAHAYTSRIHFINFSRKFCITSLFLLAPLYFLRLEYAGWQIGLVVSIYGSAPILFSYPIGWMNDSVTIRRVIQSALAVTALVFYLLSMTRQFPFMLLLFLALGIANNALDVSINNLYYKDESPVDPNRKYGRYAFFTALGSACGTLVGGLLAFLTDFRTLFIVYSMLSATILLSAGLKPFGGETLHGVGFRDYRPHLLRRKTLLFTTMLFVLALHWGAEGTVYSPFLKSYFGLNALQISLYIAPPLFALAFAALFIGLKKYDIRRNRFAFLGAMAISGLGLILMVQKNVFVSFAFRILHEIGDGMLGTLIVLNISRLFEKRTVGGSSALLLAVMTVGHMVGALIFAPIGYRVGLQVPFLISGGLLMVNALFGFYVFRTEAYG